MFNICWPKTNWQGLHNYSATPYWPDDWILKEIYLIFQKHICFNICLIFVGQKLLGRVCTTTLPHRTGQKIERKLNKPILRNISFKKEQYWLKKSNMCAKNKISERNCCDVVVYWRTELKTHIWLRLTHALRFLKNRNQ